MSGCCCGSLLRLLGLLLGFGMRGFSVGLAPGPQAAASRASAAAAAAAAAATATAAAAGLGVAFSPHCSPAAGLGVAFSPHCSLHFTVEHVRAGEEKTNSSFAHGQVKMRELGVTTHPDYKVTLLMDHKSMVTVSTDKYGALLL